MDISSKPAKRLQQLRALVVRDCGSTAGVVDARSAASGTTNLQTFAALLGKLKRSQGDSAKCIRLVHFFLQRGLVDGANVPARAAVRVALGVALTRGAELRPAGELAHKFPPRQMLAWRTLAAAVQSSSDAAQFMQIARATRVFDAVSKGSIDGRIVSAASTRKGGGLFDARSRAKERQERSDDRFSLPFIFSAVRVACCSAAQLRPQLVAVQNGGFCAKLLDACVRTMSTESRDAARHAAQTVLACCRADAKLAAQCAKLLAPGARAIVAARGASAAGLLLPDQLPRLNLHDTVAAVVYVRICAKLAAPQHAGAAARAGGGDARACFVDVLTSTLLPLQQLRTARAARCFRVQIEASQQLMRIYEWRELEAMHAAGTDASAVGSVASLLLGTLASALAEQRAHASSSLLPPVLVAHTVARVAALAGRRGGAQCGATAAPLVAELQACLSRDSWTVTATSGSGSSNQLLRFALLHAVVWLFHLEAVPSADATLVAIERVAIAARQCDGLANARRVRAGLVRVVGSLIERLKLTADAREAVLLLRVCFQLGMRSANAAGNATPQITVPPSLLIEAFGAVVELLGARGQVRGHFSRSDIQDARARAPHPPPARIVETRPPPLPRPPPQRARSPTLRFPRSVAAAGPPRRMRAARRTPRIRIGNSGRCKQR